MKRVIIFTMILIILLLSSLMFAAKTVHIEVNSAGVQQQQVDPEDIRKEAHTMIDVLFNRITATIASITALVTALGIAIVKIKKLRNLIPFLKNKPVKKAKKND